MTEVIEKYVVYELDGIMGSETQGLIKVDFNRCDNYFETEKEAIGALVNEEKKWNDYVILKQIRVTDF